MPFKMPNDQIKIEHQKNAKLEQENAARIAAEKQKKIEEEQQKRIKLAENLSKEEDISKTGSETVPEPTVRKLNGDLGDIRIIACNIADMIKQTNRALSSEFTKQRNTSSTGNANNETIASKLWIFAKCVFNTFKASWRKLSKKQRNICYIILAILLMVTYASTKPTNADIKDSYSGGSRIESCSTHEADKDNSSSENNIVEEPQHVIIDTDTESEETVGLKLSKCLIEQSRAFSFPETVTDMSGFVYTGDNIGVCTIRTAEIGSAVFDISSGDYSYIGGLLAREGEALRTIRVTFYGYYGEVIGWEQLGDVVELDRIADPRVVCVPCENGCTKIKINVEKLDINYSEHDSGIILMDFRAYNENPNNLIELPKYLDETDVDKETASALERVGTNGRAINKLPVLYSHNFDYVDEFTDMHSNVFLGDNIAVLETECTTNNSENGYIYFSTDSRSYTHLGGAISVNGEVSPIDLSIYGYCNGELIQIGETLTITSAACPMNFCVPLEPGCTRLYIYAEKTQATYYSDETRLMLHNFRLYKEDPTEKIESELQK